MSESHAANHTHHELGFVRKYIFSTDHKIIGIQYLITAMAMAVIGGLLSMLMRYQLGWPHDLSPMMAKLFPDRGPTTLHPYREVLPEKACGPLDA